MNTVRGDAHQRHMRGGAQKSFLQVAAHAVRNRKRDDQRSDSRTYSENRDDRNDAKHGLTPLCAEIARRDEHFKSHVSPYNNLETSHILCAIVDADCKNMLRALRLGGRVSSGPHR